MIVTSSILVAGTTTVLLNPKVQKIGNRFSLFDRLDARKTERNEVVRIGGVSIFIGYFIGILISLLFLYNLSNTYIDIKLSLIIAIGSFLFFLIGFFDDIYTVPYWKRLILQISVSSFIWNFGLSIKTICIPFLFKDNIYITLPNLISYLITITWIVGITNSINWIDGMDGLAAGVTVIATFSIFIIAVTNGQTTLAMLSGSLVGASLGFLHYNFYPSKILMGDGGSYLLGFLLASLSILLSQNSNKEEYIYTPLIMLAVPIIDMTYVLFKRIKYRKSPFLPDRNHLHHRLIKCNLSHKKTVLVIYLLSMLISLLAIILKNNPGMTLLLILPISLVIYDNLGFDLKNKLTN